MTDAELVERLKAREAEAYREVVTRYGNGLYRYLYGLTGNHHLAEDVVSEVYLRMLENIDRYTYSGIPFQAWLYRIAHNSALNMIKRNQRTVTINTLEQIEEPSADPAIPVSIELEAGEVREALALLTEEQRQVILLRFVERQRLREVAVTLNKTETAVKQLQLRAVRALARHLRGKH